MAVAALDLPTERAQLLGEVSKREDLLGRLVRLELVPVDDHPEVPARLAGSRLQCLEVLTLLQFPVAGHHNDSAATTEQALCPRNASSFRDPHPQRPRVRLDPGDADVGMAVEASESPEPHQLVCRDHSQRVQDRVQTGDVVALRREVDVAFGIGEAQFTRVQLLVEEVDHDVHGAETRAEMAGARPLDRGERIGPSHVCDQGEVVAGTFEFGRGDQLELGHRSDVIHYPARGATAERPRSRRSPSPGQLESRASRC